MVGGIRLKKYHVKEKGKYSSRSALRMLYFLGYKLAVNFKELKLAGTAS